MHMQTSSSLIYQWQSGTDATTLLFRLIHRGINRQEYIEMRAANYLYHRCQNIQMKMMTNTHTHSYKPKSKTKATTKKTTTTTTKTKTRKIQRGAIKTAATQLRTTNAVRESRRLKPYRLTTCLPVYRFRIQRVNERKTGTVCNYVAASSNKRLNQQGKNLLPTHTLSSLHFAVLLKRHELGKLNKKRSKERKI